jgi:hypothetical protein
MGPGEKLGADAVPISIPTRSSCCWNASMDAGVTISGSVQAMDVGVVSWGFTGHRAPHTVTRMPCREVPLGVLAALQNPVPVRVRVPLPPNPLVEGENAVKEDWPWGWGGRGRRRAHRT